MSAEVRPNGNETQYETLHNASVSVGALVGGADGSVLGSADSGTLGHCGSLLKPSFIQLPSAE